MSQLFFKLLIKVKLTLPDFGETDLLSLVNTSEIRNKLLEIILANVNILLNA